MFELSGDSNNRGFKKVGFHLITLREFDPELTKPIIILLPAYFFFV